MFKCVYVWRQDSIRIFKACDMAQSSRSYYWARCCPTKIRNQFYHQLRFLDRSGPVRKLWFRFRTGPDWSGLESEPDSNRTGPVFQTFCHLYPWRKGNALQIEKNMTRICLIRHFVLYVPGLKGRLLDPLVSTHRPCSKLFSTIQYNLSKPRNQP